MPKFYMWLTTCHLVFVKVFGHLTKMPSCFNSRQNKITEKKIKRKGKQAHLPLAPGEAHLASAGPAHPRCCRLPPWRPKQLGGEPWARRRHRGLSGAPSSPPGRHDDASDVPHPSPLHLVTLQLSLSRFLR